MCNGNGACIFDRVSDFFIFYCCSDVIFWSHNSSFLHVFLTAAATILIYAAKRERLYCNQTKRGRLVFKLRMNFLITNNVTEF